MKYLIVDDELLARERMVRLLQVENPAAQWREAANGPAALALLDEFMPDVVLLDVKMPGMDGIAVAAQLSELAEPPAIIFCTAYDQYALKALDYQAVAYLLKPVRQSELAAALARAGRVNKVQLASIQRHNDSALDALLSQKGSEIETVDLSQVRCFIATDKLVVAHTPRGEHVMNKSLRQLEHSLQGQFIRTHRNALVAITGIRALRRDESGGWIVDLHDSGVQPAVSRRHYGDVKKCLLERQQLI